MRIFVSTFLCLILAISAYFFSPLLLLQYRIYQVDSLIVAQRYQEAIPYLQLIVNHYATTNRSADECAFRRRLSHVHLELKHYSEAIPHLEKVIDYYARTRSTTREYAYREKLARTLLASNEEYRAIQQYERILEYNNNHAEANFVVGMEFWKRSVYKYAENYLSKAARNSSEYSSVYRAFLIEKNSPPPSSKETFQRLGSQVWQVVKPQASDFIPLIGWLRKGRKFYRTARGIQRIHRMRKNWKRYRALRSAKRISAWKKFRRNIQRSRF